MAKSVPGFESNWELVAIFENSNPKKSTNKHQKYARKNATKYILIARK